jgi:hypothetical protein
MFDVTSIITRSKNNVIFNVFQNNKIDQLNGQFNKYVLGAGKKTSIWAVVGELGRYSLYIIISIIKYWIHLHDDTSSPILRAALDENYGMFQSDQHCWLTCIHIILKELNLLSIVYSLISCGNKEINELKHRLKDNFAQIWKTNINLIKFNNTTNRNENKLRTYSKFKTIFK